MVQFAHYFILFLNQSISKEKVQCPFNSDLTTQKIINQLKKSKPFGITTKIENEIWLQSKSIPLRYVINDMADSI